MEILCACGCGQHLSDQDAQGRIRHFVLGHAMRGRHHSADARRKIGAAGQGRHPSPETRERMKASSRLVNADPERRARHSVRTREWMAAHPGIYSGSNHPQWSGGMTMATGGYVLEWCRGHPGANRSGHVLQHRLVMERHLGRILASDEVVHHIDGDKTNNEIANLLLLSSQAEHARFHDPKFGRRPSDLLSGRVEEVLA